MIKKPATNSPGGGGRGGAVLRRPNDPGSDRTRGKRSGRTARERMVQEVGASECLKFSEGVNSPGTDFFFKTCFYSGNVVLQIMFCLHSIETQEIDICVCMRIHSFKQNHKLSKSSSYLYRQMSLDTLRSLSDFTVSI